MKKTLYTFYVLVFLNHFSIAFFFTTYVLFLQERGMDNFQINSINAFFMFFVFMLEIPTGSFADVIGRRKSTLWSFILTGFSMLMYYFSNIYWFFVLAEVMAALALAFSSGAFEAWLVDSLKFHNFTGALDNIFAKESIVQKIGVILGGLIGAYIGKSNLALPWLISAIGQFILFFIAWKIMKEDYLKPSKLNSYNDIKKRFIIIVRDSIIYGLKNKVVFYLILLHTGFQAGLMAFNMYWTLKFKEHMSQEFLGWLWVIISLAMIVGSLSVRYTAKINRQSKRLLFYLFITGLSALLCVVFYQNIFWLVLFFLVHEAGREGFKPIKKAYINKHIPSDKRATIISFDSMIQKLGSVFGLLISGLIAQKYSIQYAWLFSSLIILVSGIFCFKLNGEEN